MEFEIDQNHKIAPNDLWNALAEVEAYNELEGNEPQEEGVA